MVNGVDGCTGTGQMENGDEGGWLTLAWKLEGGCRQA